MKERAIVFDASTMISLASNNLLWILGPLRAKFKGNFYIPPGVKLELIDIPLKSKRFKLEAMQILAEVAKGSLIVYGKDKELEKETMETTNLVNSIFMARDNYIRIMHHGEISVLALAKKVDAIAMMIDERTTRVLVEDPYRMVELLQSRLHTHITVNQENLMAFQRSIKKVPIMRSAELGVIAYELGLFDSYAEGSQNHIKNPTMNVLDALLWGMKLRGCAISTLEIEELLRLEGFAKI